MTGGFTVTLAIPRNVDENNKVIELLTPSEFSHQIVVLSAKQSKETRSSRNNPDPLFSDIRTNK